MRRQRPRGLSLRDAAQRPRCLLPLANKSDSQSLVVTLPRVRRSESRSPEHLATVVHLKAHPQRKLLNTCSPGQLQLLAGAAKLFFSPGLLGQ